jgi:hypothetical protein
MMNITREGGDEIQAGTHPWLTQSTASGRRLSMGGTVGQSTQLSVRLPSGVQVERVSLVDMKGQVVYLRFEDLRLNSSPDMGANLKLQINKIKSPPGLYTLIIASRDGRMFSEKVVIE